MSNVAAFVASTTSEAGHVALGDIEPCDSMAKVSLLAIFSFIGFRYPAGGQHWNEPCGMRFRGNLAQIDVFEHES